MGYFNLSEVIDGFRSGNLDNVINDFDENDLVILLKELKGFISKNDYADGNELILEIEQRIEQLSS
jgi:hypothetical protein